MAFSTPLHARDCVFVLTQPAYSHNDYHNERPLHDALARGYRGVEADLVLDDGKLLVGHSRKETDSRRTLEQLYLKPLRELIRRCGGVYPDHIPFLLTVELKEQGRETYHALRQGLRITHDGVRAPDGADELVGLLSFNYGRTLRWRGRGVVPGSDRKVLAGVRRARQARPGVVIRALNVPAVAQVYQLLFDAGVDLIGTEDLARTQGILCGLRHLGC